MRDNQNDDDPRLRSIRGLLELAAGAGTVVARRDAGAAGAPAGETRPHRIGDRTFEIRDWRDGDTLVAAGFEGGRKVTARVVVEGEEAADFARRHGDPLTRMREHVARELARYARATTLAER